MFLERVGDILFPAAFPANMDIFRERSTLSENVKEFIVSAFELYLQVFFPVIFTQIKL